ncbi:MAG: class I SAM-dependent methyltransferase [Candidatus Omnitrophota bacterium]|jgi:hypothetical protein
MYKEITKCRICGNTELLPILNLGRQALTGIFPKDKTQEITEGPLELVKCNDENNANCGLVQLKHSYSLPELYGDNYGYRSGLNKSMIKHLHNKVREITKLVELSSGDLVIDIGSNDSTLLQAYPDNKGLILAGVDPTGIKFREYYPAHIHLISEFFSAKVIRNKFGRKKAKIITSIAMFYDLDSPVDFMREIYDILDEKGVWVFEQSYLPSMLEVNAYDTVCHEHLEYYAFKQIKWMAEKVGFEILDVKINAVNGGSFSVAVAKRNSAYRPNRAFIDTLLTEEKKKGFNTSAPYKDFCRSVFKHRDELSAFLEEMKNKGKMILGYGASTKGNVILQFCQIKADSLPFIAEVNKDKFGAFTPGTLIPIVSEEEARKMNPDYFMVLPWHFKEGIIKKERGYLDSGGKLFFPLPALEVFEEGG